MEALRPYFPSPEYSFGEEAGGKPLTTLFAGAEHDPSPPARVTVEQIWSRVLSRSFIAVLPEKERAALEERVR
jgi:hypothetical protein